MSVYPFIRFVQVDALASIAHPTLTVERIFAAAVAAPAESADALRHTLRSAFLVALADRHLTHLQDRLFTM